MKPKAKKKQARTKDDTLKAPKFFPTKKPKSVPKQISKHATVLEAAKFENPSITSDQIAFQLGMEPQEIHRMRVFLSEYMRDFNEFNAAMRMGYPEVSAKSTGRMFLYHSYSQLKLQEILDGVEAEALINSARIIAGLMKEAHAEDVPFSSNSSTRIMALKELAKIKGLTAPKVADQGPLIRRVMLVPLTDNWESQAMQSQKALKEYTHIDV